MILDGALGTSCVDSSGEVLDIQGADISDWEEGSLLCNWEHEPGERGASTIVGKVVFAHKVYEKKDCQNDRQTLYWNQIKAPFIYGVIRLFDTAGHKEAINLAAIVRDCAKNNEPIVVRYSVEGSTLERQGQCLKRTVIRRCALTVKPCNRTAISGLISDEAAPPGFDKIPEPKAKTALASILERLEGTEKAESPDPRYQKLGQSFEHVGSPWVEDAGLEKALTAGGMNAAPIVLTGGSALQREDAGLQRRKLVAVCKGIARDWHPGVPFKAFAKAVLAKMQLPDVSDEFLDHFEGLLHHVRANLKKADGPVAAEAPKEPTGGLTRRGKALPAPTVKRVSFDPVQGVLHTPKGSVPLNNPDKDPDHPESGEAFKSIWHSERVRKVHDYATRQWIRLNQALKEGRCPEGVLSTAASFSFLSKNTGVAVHELMYGHLLDTQRKLGVDLRSPGFASIPVYEDWVTRDQPQGTPEASHGYFADEIDDLLRLKNATPDGLRQVGDRPAFQLAGEFDNDPGGKFASMARYHHSHDYLVDLVKRYGTDARGAATEMMDDRVRKAAWEARRSRGRAAGKLDIGEYPLDHGLFGMRNKLARFMLSMTGMGNSFVPDTHFVRHLLGMDKSQDGPALEYLKTGVLWEPKNAGILGQMDRWYFENHPSVRYMLAHPEFGAYFKSDPEQAIFPAFWAHWLCIGPHEAALEHARTGDITNQQAYHKPFFEEADRLASDPNEPRIPARSPFNRAPPPGDAREPMGDISGALRGWNDVAKAEAVIDGPMIHPVNAGALVRDWNDQFGPAAASFRFYSSLVPLLMPEVEAHPGHPLAKTVPYGNMPKNKRPPRDPEMHDISPDVPYEHPRHKNIQDMKGWKPDPKCKCATCVKWREQIKKGELAKGVDWHAYSKEEFDRRALGDDLLVQPGDRVTIRDPREERWERPGVISRVVQDPKRGHVWQVGAKDESNPDAPEILFHRIAPGWGGYAWPQSCRRCKAAKDGPDANGGCFRCGAAKIDPVGMSLVHAPFKAEDEDVSKSQPTTLQLEALSIDVKRLELLVKAFEGTQPEKPSAKAQQPKPTSSETQLSSKVHGVAELNTSPEQNALVDSLDLSNRLSDDDKPVHVEYGVTAPVWFKLKDGREAIVKHEGAGQTRYGPEKEVAYHNLARDFFGLGPFVPTTAAFRHPESGDVMSVQEGVENAEHLDTKAPRHGLWPWSPSDPAQKAWLRQHHLAGDLDKLHLMNLVLGNGDRRDANYLFSLTSEPHLRMIDHGHAFSSWGHPQATQPVKGQAWIPNYSTQLRRMLQEDDAHDMAQEPLHNGAGQWLMGLDKAKLAEQLKVFPFIDARLPLGYLDQLQKNYAANPRQARWDLFKSPELRYR